MASLYPRISVVRIRKKCGRRSWKSAKCRQLHTVTPALWLARFAHLNDCAQTQFRARSTKSTARGSEPVRLGKSSWSLRMRLPNVGFGAIIGRLHEPTGNIIERLPSTSWTAEDCLNLCLLLLRLPLKAQVRRISADIRLPALVLEVDLRLIQRRVEQIITMTFTPVPVGGQTPNQSSRKGVAAGDPVRLFERQELLRGRTARRDRGRRTGTWR